MGPPRRRPPPLKPAQEQGHPLPCWLTLPQDAPFCSPHPAGLHTWDQFPGIARVHREHRVVGALQALPPVSTCKPARELAGPAEWHGGLSHRCVAGSPLGTPSPACSASQPPHNTRQKQPMAWGHVTSTRLLASARPSEAVLAIWGAIWWAEDLYLSQSLCLSQKPQKGH